MEYKTCKTCNNHKPVVQFASSTTRRGAICYRSCCKFCTTKGEKLFEKLYLIPEKEYLTRICSKCSIPKSSNSFFKTKRSICKQCHMASSAETSKLYFKSDKGKLTLARNNYKRVDNISDAYIIAQYRRREILEPTEKQIEFKRAIIFAKRKLELTHSKGRIES